MTEVPQNGVAPRWSRVMGQLSKPRRTRVRSLDQDGLPSERAPGACFGAESVITIDPRQVLRRLRPVVIDQLIAAYAKGLSVRRLVELFGVHRTTVLAHLERHGVARRRSVCKLTGADGSESDPSADACERGRDVGAPLGRLLQQASLARPQADP